MTELISIREAARRLGVSDTAVHKAIAAGRVSPAQPDPVTGHKRMAWPECETEWNRNTDATKRTLVGAVPGSARSKEPPPPGGPSIKPTDADDDGDENAIIAPGIPSITESKAKKEKYLAEKAQMEAELMAGKLIYVDDVKKMAFKHNRSARDAIMTLPDRISPILASMTDLHDINQFLVEEFEKVCVKITQAATLSTE